MRTTLAYVNQLYFVKKMASAGLTIDKIPEGELGIVDEATGLTVSAIPQTGTFRLVKTFNGKPWFLIDSMEKGHIRNVVGKEYSEEVVHELKTVIDFCECINRVDFSVSVESNAVFRDTGKMYKDYGTAETSPVELECLCNGCGENQTYANNIFTLYLYKKINAMHSPYFKAKVTKKDGGEELADEKAILEFIEQNKAVNTDADKTNDTGMLALHIVGIKQDHHGLKPHEHVPLSAIYLKPSLRINDKMATPFEVVSEPKGEIGSGVDMRSLEWENFNFYTNNNYYHHMEDNFFDPDIEYQFEKEGKYDTVTLEFDTQKVYRAGTNERKTIGLVLGMNHDDSLMNTVKALFE